MRNLNQDSWSPGADLNQGLPEYEAGVLTTRPRPLGFGYVYCLHLQGSGQDQRTHWHVVEMKANLTSFSHVHVR
jgi:hypothetical protein